MHDVELLSKATHTQIDIQRIRLRKSQKTAQHNTIHDDITSMLNYLYCCWFCAFCHKHTQAHSTIETMRLSRSHSLHVCFYITCLSALSNMSFRIYWLHIYNTYVQKKMKCFKLVCVRETKQSKKKNNKLINTQKKVILNEQLTFS